MRNKFLVTLLGGTALAWEAQNLCEVQQCDENPLGLESNTEYVYSHKLSSSVSRSDQNDGDIANSQARVTLKTGQNPCSLQINVDQSDNQDVNSLPLRFSYEDGQVKTVCPHPDETPESLNFKRTLVSMFQTRNGAETDALESDVYGKCITDFEVSGNERRKTKYLNKCAHTQRDTLLWTFGRMASLDEAMEGQVSCLMKQHNGPVDSVKCVEQRTLKQPFQEDRLFESHIEASLTLEGDSEHSGLDEYSFEEIGSLGFDLNQNDEQVDSNKAALETLNDLCNAESSIENYQNVPAFMQILMQNMQKLSSIDLINLWEVAQSTCSRGRETVEQILGWCGSEECFRAGSVIAAKGNDMSEWIESMVVNGAPSPTVVELLFQHADYMAANGRMMNLGQAIDRACTAGFCGHQSIARVQAWLDEQAADACEKATNDGELRNVLAGIEHSRRVSAETFSTCVGSPNLRNSHLMQVMRAATGAECSRIAPLLMDLVTAVDRVGVEVRAAAYFGLWSCPTVENVAKLSEWYAEEPSLQMQHLMHSHITSIRYSVDPLKHFLKPFASQMNIEAPIDYNNHQDYSKFWDVTAPFGHHALTADGYVIYERESPLPRAIHANLSLSLYDEPLNLFDVRLRQENLQKLLFPTPEANNDNDVVDVSNGNFEADYGTSNLDVDVKLFGRSILSSTFEEDDLQAMKNKSFMWRKFTDKVSKFEFVEAFRMMMGRSNIELNKNIVLGLFTMRMPNLAGTETRLAFDIVGSTSINIEAQGIGFKSFSGVFTPKATVELNAEYTLGLGGNKLQGLRANINGATATTNAIELSMTDGNYGLRIDTPDQQNVLSVKQEIAVISSEGEQLLEPEIDMSSEKNAFGHRFYFAEKKNENCEFLQSPYELQVGVVRTDPKMTHFAAQVVKTNTMWSGTLGFPQSSENFVIKAWYDNDQVYTTGFHFTGFETSLALETEIDVINNEAKVKYTNVDGRVFKMHGRSEQNADGSVHTMIVVQAPSKKYELLSRYINEPAQKSVAFDLSGFPKKIHADVTLQQTAPTFAINLQMGQYKFHSDFDYSETPVYGGGTNYTIAYVISIPKHDMFGTTEFILRENEWSFQSSLRSDLLQSRPLLVSAMYRLTQEHGRTEVKLLVPAVRLPGIIDISNSKFAVLIDPNGNRYGLSATSSYTVKYKVKNVQQQKISIITMYQGESSGFGGNFRHTVTLSEESLAKFSHSLEYNMQPVINDDDTLGQISSSIELKWSDFEDKRKMIAVHQFFNQQVGPAQQSFFMGMNGTAFGDSVKLFSEMRKKGPKVLVDLRAKYGDIDELELIKPATLVIKVENALATKSRLEVRGDLKLPAYVARHWTKNEEVEAAFKAFVRRVRAGVLEYLVSVSIPLSVDTENGPAPMKANLKGRFINTKLQFETSSIVNYIGSEIFRFGIQSRTTESESISRKVAICQLKYPEMKNGGFELVEAIYKFKFTNSNAENNVETELINSFTSNQATLVAYELNNLQLTSAIRIQNLTEPELFAFNIAARTSKTKKAEIDVAYDGDDSSISVDLRQTYSPEAPAMLSGSGRYDKKDGRVTVNFNRDKNPITIFINFPSSAEEDLKYQIEIRNGDENLLKKQVPRTVNAGLTIDGEEFWNSLAKVQFNATWATNRGIGILISNLAEDTKVVTFFEMANNALANLPKHLTVQSDLQVPDSTTQWATNLEMNEIYTLETSLEASFLQSPVKPTFVQGGFVNNLVKGPYSGSGRIELGKDLKATAQWENQYKGNTPCEFETVIADRFEGGKLSYTCDDVNNDYKIRSQFHNGGGKLFVQSVENNQYIDAYLNIVDDSFETFAVEAGMELDFDAEAQAAPINIIGDINPLAWSWKAKAERLNIDSVAGFKVEFNEIETQVQFNQQTNNLLLTLALPREMEQAYNYGSRFTLEVSDVSKYTFDMRGKSNVHEDDIFVLAYRLSDTKNDFKFELRVPLEDQRASVNFVRKFTKYGYHQTEFDEISVSLLKDNGDNKVISFVLDVDDDIKGAKYNFMYILNLPVVQSNLDVGFHGRKAEDTFGLLIDKHLKFSVNDLVSIDATNKAEAKNYESEGTGHIHDRFDIDIDGKKNFIDFWLTFSDHSKRSNTDLTMAIELRNSYLNQVKLDTGYLNLEDFEVSFGYISEGSSRRRREAEDNLEDSYEEYIPEEEISEYEPEGYFSGNGSGDEDLDKDSDEREWIYESYIPDYYVPAKQTPVSSSLSTAGLNMEAYIRQNFYSLDDRESIQLTVNVGEEGSQDAFNFKWLLAEGSSEESYQSAHLKVKSKVPWMDSIKFMMSGAINLVAEYKHELISRGNIVSFDISQSAPSDEDTPIKFVMRKFINKDSCLDKDNCLFHILAAATEDAQYNPISVGSAQFELETNINADISYYVNFLTGHSDVGIDGLAADSKSFTLEVNDRPSVFNSGVSLYRVELIGDTVNDGPIQGNVIRGSFDGSEFVDEKVNFVLQTTEDRDTDVPKMKLVFGDSKLELDLKSNTDLPMEAKLQLSLASPKFKNVEFVNVVEDFRLGFRLQNNGIKVMSRIEEHDFMVSVFFGTNSKAPKLGVEFLRKDVKKVNSLLGEALSPYDEQIRSVSHILLKLKGELVQDKSLSADSQLIIDVRNVNVSVTAGFEFSAPASRVYFTQNLDDKVPPKVAIGYKYTAATIQEPMGVDIEITFGENDEVISTDFGVELHTEGSPNARAFFNMVNKGVPVLSFLPSALDLENVISLKSAQISTVWWRNLQNFELANKFTMNEHWPETGHKSTNLEPHIKIVTRNDGLEYEVGIDHDCEYIAENGIPVGTSFVRYQVDVNREVMDMIDKITDDSNTKFESMLARMVLLVGSPVFVPTVPLQQVQKVAFSSNSRSRRQSISANYEAEASFTVSKGGEQQTLRLVEAFEQRRTSFKGSMELQNDFELLANISGRNFRFDGELDAKRKEARVAVLLHGERYLVDTKFDADASSEPGRVSLALNEIRLEQNIPLLLDVAIPAKIETTANCFVSYGEETDFLATCDNMRVVLGNVDQDDREYSASGSLKLETTTMSTDIYFDHNDQRLVDLNIPRKSHISSSGQNDPTCEEGHYCFVNSRNQLIVETSNDQFEALKPVYQAQDELRIYRHKVDKDIVHVVEYTLNSKDKPNNIYAVLTVTNNKKNSGLTMAVSVDNFNADLQANIATNRLYADVEMSTSSEVNLGAKYELDYGSGSASVYSSGIWEDDFQTGVQYTMSGEYGLGIFYQANPAELSDKDYFDSEFLEWALSQEDEYRVFLLRANHRSVLIQHASDSTPVNRVAAQWRTVPLKIEGNVVQNGANYTIHLSPTQIITTLDQAGKHKQFELGYKLVNEKRPSLVVELFHTFENLKVDPFMLSLGLGINDFDIGFEKEGYVFNFNVALADSSLVEVTVRSGDNDATVAVGLLKNKLGVEIEYANNFFQLDHTGHVTVSIDPSLAINIEFNNKEYIIELTPIVYVQNGIGRFGLVFAQNVSSSIPLSVQGLLTTELGLVSSRAAFEVVFEEEQFGECSIQANFESGFSLTISDSLVAPRVSDDDFLAEFNTSVYGAGSSLTFSSQLTVPMCEIDSELYMELVLPVFEASTEVGAIVGLRNNGVDSNYGIQAGLNLPETFVLEMIENNETIELFSWEVADLYRKLNLGFVKLEQENNVLKVTMNDGSSISFEGTISDQEVSMKVTTSADYTGPVESGIYKLRGETDSENIRLSVTFKDQEAVFGITHVEDKVEINFYQNGLTGEQIKSSRFVFINQSNKIGFAGSIDDAEAEFALSWDYDFSNSGFLNIAMTNTVTNEIPKQATFSSTWNLKSVKDNLQITAAIDTTNFHRSLMIKGGVKSAKIFALQVEHDLEILPIASFQISFSNDNNEQALTLACGNEKVEVYLTKEDKKVNLEFPSLGLPLQTLGASYGEEPVQFNIKLNDMQLGLVVNEFKTTGGNTAFDFDAVSRIPALSPQRITMKAQLALDINSVKGHFDRTFDESVHVLDFDFNNLQNELTLKVDHNDTILYALSVPEHIVLEGEVGQSLASGDQMVLHIKKFELGQIELEGKARFSLSPFAFDFKSDQLQLESKFTPERWFMRVSTDGSIPGLDYTKLSVVRMENEYIYRITDSQDQTRAIKLSMEPGQFAFTNKVVALLPEEMGLNYTASDRGLEVSSRFNTFTFKFESSLHAQYQNGGINLLAKEEHTYSENTEKNAIQIKLNHAVGNKYEPISVRIMNNDNEMGVQTIVSSKPGAGMIGYKFKNINLLRLAENFQADYSIVNTDRENSINVHVKVDQDNIKFGSYLIRDEKSNGNTVKAGIIFSHNDYKFEALKASVRISNQNGNCVGQINTFAGSIQFATNDENTVIRLIKNENEQIVYEIVHTIDLPMIELSLTEQRNKNTVELFGLRTNELPENNNLKTLSIFVFDQTSIFEVEKSGFTFMALRFCQRSGNVPTCGQEENADFTAVIQFVNHGWAYDYRGFTKHNGVEQDIFVFKLLELFQGDHKIHLWLGPYEYLDVQAKWDFSTFVDGALWSESTDYVNFAIATSKHAFEFEIDLNELMKLSYMNNGENVFSYRVAYELGLGNEERSGRSSNKVTVHSTHSIKLMEKSIDFELDVVANSMQTEINGLTTILTTVTYENEQYDVQADIEYDQDIYTVTVVTKDWLESRSSAELNTSGAEEILTAYISTPDQPDKARLTVSANFEGFDILAKYDSAEAKLNLKRAVLVFTVDSSNIGIALTCSMKQMSCETAVDYDFGYDIEKVLVNLLDGSAEFGLSSDGFDASFNLENIVNDGLTFVSQDEFTAVLFESDSGRFVVKFDISEYIANGKHSAELGWSEYTTTYSYQHGQVQLRLNSEKSENQSAIDLSFGNVGSDRYQVTFSALNTFTWSFNSNDAAALFFLGPSEHKLQVNVPLREFDEALVTVDNTWSSGDSSSQNVMNGNFAMTDDTFAISIEDVYTDENGERFTIEFETALEVTQNEYSFGSALNFNDDVVYDANALANIEANGDNAGIELTLRTMDDHFFQNSFSYQLNNFTSFVDAEVAVNLRTQVDDSLPVQFSFDKKHIFQSGRIFACNMEFGDFKSEVGIQSFAIGIDSSVGDISMTVVVDEHTGKFGIADPSRTAFSPFSFASGISLFVELPEFIDFPSGRVGLDIVYDNTAGEYGISVENVAGIIVNVKNEDNFRVRLANKMDFEILPKFDVQLALANKPDSTKLEFAMAEPHQAKVELTFAETSVSLRYRSQSNSNQDINDVTLILKWADELEFVFRRGDEKPIKHSINQRTAEKIIKNIMSLKPVFIMTKTDRLLRSTVGVQYNKTKYVFLAELVLNDDSVALQFAVQQGSEEPLKLFTFEAGANKNYDVDFFVSYDDAIHDILMLEPVNIVNMAKLRIRSFLTGANKLATALINGFSNEQVNSISEIQKFMADIFFELDNITRKIEELAPEAVIEQRQVTIREIIVSAVGLSENDINEKIEWVREQINMKVNEAVSQLLNQQEPSFSRTEAGRQFFKVYSESLKMVAEQVTNYALRCLNIVNTSSKSFILVENNNIFITIPLPDIKLPGMDKSLVAFLKDNNFESALYQMSAFFSEKNEYRLSNELEGEVLGPYVRQFDGQWVFVNEADLDQILSVSDPQNELRQYPLEDENVLVFADKWTTRNRNFGLFGVPDSEIYSDDVSHLPVESTRLSEMPIPDNSTQLSDYLTASVSPARPCFSVVSSESYQKMVSVDPVKVAAAYQARCASFGVHIDSM